ncbi:hypothetical protein HMPREF0673_02662 [Leyella stercorea DSM 18206]|uniref:Uncharacterized protein n=1 Tax=Leyella stercorea DSM 18206 TaxID=1002367 RepID=G6B191_9BACT|nr:hypothetical protein HMPREF0673_02662 [Leyella stercorea DSM 18206]
MFKKEQNLIAFCSFTFNSSLFYSPNSEFLYNFARNYNYTYL